VGSPLWITAWLVVLLYGRAWLAGVPFAGTAAASALLAFTVVGVETTGLQTLTAPQPWPLLAIGALALLAGVRRRSSACCLAGAVLCVCGIWLVLPRTVAADFRMTVTYHTLWVATIVIGLSFRDRLALILRLAGAVQIPAAALVALASSPAEAVPLAWRLAYVAALAATALAIAGLWRQRWYLYAFFALLGMAMYGGAMLGYRQAVSAIGRPAMAAITWSGGALLVAFLISARKANWLPAGLLPRPRAGGGSTPGEVP
jgi:hypothetical protein